MSNERVLLVGHSHANCVAIAMRRRIYEPKAAEYTPRMIANGASSLPGGLVVTDASGREIANPIVLKTVIDNARLRPKPRIWLVSILGGNHASRLSLFQHGERYWISGTDNERDPEAKGTMIPRDAMVMTLERQVRSLEKFIRLLPRQHLAAIIHVEAPPPVRSADFIFSHLPEQTLALAASNGISDLGVHSIADADYRLRVWECQARATRKLVESAGGDYLVPPADTRDADGFLAEEYRADAMHASPEYGAKVLRMVEEHIMQRVTVLSSELNQ